MAVELMGETPLRTATASTETQPRAIALSTRQHAVLQCLAQGDTNKAIAYKLNLSASTVNVHVRNLMKALGARNRTQVVIFAWPLLKR
jgi:DNA-binding NarL/FixJ family response regulator